MRAISSRLPLALVASLAGSPLLLVGCPEEESRGRPDAGLEAITLMSVAPDALVPGSTIVIRGDGFLDASVADSYLGLSGTIGGAPVNVQLAAAFVDFDELHVVLTPDVLALLPTSAGQFVGSAQVASDYRPTATRIASPLVPVTLDFAATLEPVLGDLQVGGEIYVNDPLPIEGDGFLLGGMEGTTLAVVEGCFESDEAPGDCVPVGPVEVPLVPTEPESRTRATFAFSPAIAGIRPGHFSGTIALRNSHPSGAVVDGTSILDVQYQMIATEILATGTSSGTGASLGQYIDIDGGGFLGGTEGLTILQLEGTYTPDVSPEGAPVSLQLIPEFVDGRRVRYVINEDDGLGTAIDVRLDSGIFDGTMTPIVSYGADEIEGQALPLMFAILPVKQVVWVRFQASYAESLRVFGLRALDSMIRERILEVLRRDYASINIEFREQEPTDFALFGTVDISGPDPNGLDLLGYDNSHGKDTGNARLFDNVGGVNALTQQDGFPGFGGVFIESLFAFSEHPPQGKESEVSDPLFDDIFDPFRPDEGSSFTSADLAMGQVPKLTSGGGCPTDERLNQAACAVWVLGSMIGTTTSHENGHALGLADPLGTRFHNLGDAPNRLMDAGGARTLNERAELNGEGPAVFCDDEYQYLREVLPSTDPETTVVRPYC